jgi:hypothetical protein
MGTRGKAAADGLRIVPAALGNGFGRKKKRTAAKEPL